MAEWAGEEYVPDQLWHLLHHWMGPKWFWSSWKRKFITEKEFRMEEERRDLISPMNKSIPLISDSDILRKYH